jgi:AraC family transcriptional regulator of adaptative response/methylated-DNA-[protein]-cysteine methyltransferase
VKQILDHLSAKKPRLELPLDIRATAFQRQVWEALRAIPYGETRSYGDVAREIGQPKAVRAVARACATNPVALVIPCHRVIREDKSLGGYRWGIERKRRLLQEEKNKSRKG